MEQYTMNEQLQKLAQKRSIPFCYGCYIDVPAGKCSKCGSDDLMRKLEGVGVEYGTEWIIKHIIESELESIDVEQSFIDSLEGCYPETTTVGFLELDTISTMKECDPIAFQCAQSEYENSMVEDEQWISFDNGGTYYQVSDVETLISRVE